jgi:flagellar motility protein MotE (MotC chaperone)
VSTVGPGAGPFGRLSWLLMATALALLLPLAGRVDSLWDHRRAAAHATVAVVAAEVERATPAPVEPAAGPASLALRTPPQPSLPPAPPAASLDPPLAAALEELASELGRRQTAIAEREQTLALREAVVRSVESRVAGQISRLETLNGDLERRLGQVSADEQARIAQLVKVYEAMKAKSAALIFDPMGLDLLLPIVRGMRETKVAAIVAEMDPAKARALTAELARSRGPPP